MQYDNEYDLDHNDCPEYENEIPEEFASDYAIEPDDDEYEEYPATPSEFGSDEQVATTDLTDLYESKDSDNITAPYHDGCNCDSESAYDNETEEDYNGDAVNYNSDSAYEYNEKPFNDPSEEQAATRDECYNNDNCHCKSAQEKCRLDDYEIISDVLGSEKQIVKLYSTALCETAEENLRDIIRENFTEAAADQYKAFSFMQSKGMYKTEQATEENITQAKQQFTPLN